MTIISSNEEGNSTLLDWNGLERINKERKLGQTGHIQNTVPSKIRCYCTPGDVNVSCPQWCEWGCNRDWSLFQHTTSTPFTPICPLLPAILSFLTNGTIGIGRISISLTCNCVPSARNSGECGFPGNSDICLEMGGEWEGRPLLPWLKLNTEPEKNFGGCKAYLILKICKTSCQN